MVQIGDDEPFRYPEMDYGMGGCELLMQAVRSGQDWSPMVKKADHGES